MNDALKKVVKYVLSLMVAAVLLYYSFRGVDWHEFIAGLGTCRWGLVLLSMTAGLAAFVFRALRWRRLMLPIDPTIDRLTVFDAVNIGNISNFIIQYLGELVRTGIIVGRNRTRKARYDSILGTVVLERGWDVISLIILFVILLAFRWGEFGSFFRDEIWTRFTGRFSSAAWLVLAALVAVIAALVAAVWLLRGRVGFCGKVCNAFKGIFTGIGSCLRMEHKWLFMLYTAAIWAMYWLMMVFMTGAFPATSAAGLGLVDALFLMLVGSIASFIPVPGGFGAYHFLVSTALMALYGFSRGDGMVFATLAHESQAVNMVIWGAVAYLVEMIRSDRRAEE